MKPYVAKMRKKLLFFIIASLIFSSIVFVYKKSALTSLISFAAFFTVLFLYSFFSQMLKKIDRIRKIESVFPDFLQLMSSNLRAGMTIDRAMLLSARPEFQYLDQEITIAGRQITTGKSTESALSEMADRIDSEKIQKTIYLIISGIKAGGNIAILLEETASNMRERGFVEKKAASNVLMYVIFIFAAVSLFAPALYALSNILVEILTDILSGIPETTAAATVSLPFTLSKINISISFVNYFSIIFIIVTGILASLVLGMVNTGEEKEGMKYMPIILVLSLGVFFFVKFALRNFMSGFFG